MPQPLEVTQALTADALGQRYGCLPSEVLAADVENLRIAEIASLMQPRKR